MFVSRKGLPLLEHGEQARSPQRWSASQTAGSLWRTLHVGLKEL